MTRPLAALAAGLLLAAAAPGPARGQDAPRPAAPKPAPLAVKTETNVVYDTIDRQDLLLDVCAPTEGGPYPRGSWAAARTCRSGRRAGRR